MVSQYPHTAFVTIPNQTVQDPNGNWVAAPGLNASFETRCRLEPRLGANNAYILGADGAKIEISAIIYLPKGSPAVPVGAMIRINNGSTMLVNSNVKQYSAGQLNARAWI